MAIKPRTIGIVGAGAALVAGLLYFTFRVDPIAVDLHTITSGQMELTIDADGKTQIRDLYEVSAPITGTALRSPVNVGDIVVGGQTVVAIVEPVAPSLLDSRSRVQAEAAVREAEAALLVTQSDLHKATEDQVLALGQFSRVKTLVERGVSSITQLEDAQQRLFVADAAVEAAQARVDMSTGSLERSRAALIDPNSSDMFDGGCCVQIPAPSDGVVLSVATISERPVLAGAQLLSIGDPTNIELVVDLLSSDAVRLQPGTPARVDRWGGDTLLAATLDRVEPSARTKVSALGIEEQRVDAIFLLTSQISERRNLGDGFSVFVHIIEWQADDVPQVPLSAIFKRNDSWAVYISADAVIEEREVFLGKRGTRFAEVLDGLSIGDQVVMHPADSIAAGSRIIERNSL